MRLLSIYLFLLCFVCVPICVADVTGEEVAYSDGETTLKGYIALPAVEGPAPAVLVVHEWWGHNEYVRRRARMLAELGYVALAVDMYGEGKTASHPRDAGKFASAVSQTKGLREKRFRAAMEYLESRSEVKTTDIAAIGYCFGGNTVIEMARAGVPLQGVVSFHGSLGLAGPVKKGVMVSPLLVLHGASDTFISKDELSQFKSSMKSGEADMTFIAYPGVKHSFTNPDADALAKMFEINIGYDKKADEASWQAMKDFFKRVLG